MKRRISPIARRKSRSSSGAGSSYQSILGSNLVMMFHSQMLVNEPAAGESDAWTDAITGTRTIIQGTPAQRVLYAPQGSQFGGKKVIQTDRVGQRFLSATGLGVIVPAGSKPWCYARLSYQATGAAEGNSAVCGSNGDLQVFITNAAGVNRRKIGPSATTIDVAGLTTGVESWQSWSDGSNRNFIVNGVMNQDATNAATVADITAWAVGNTPGATRYSRVSIGVILMTLAYPGAAAAAAAVALAEAEFPP